MIKSELRESAADTLDCTLCADPIKAGDYALVLVGLTEGFQFCHAGECAERALSDIERYGHCQDYV
jgi:hypothetical protein